MWSQLSITFQSYSKYFKSIMNPSSGYDIKVFLWTALPIDIIQNEWTNDVLLSSLYHQSIKSWILFGYMMDWCRIYLVHKCVLVMLLQRILQRASWGACLSGVVWPQFALSALSCWLTTGLVSAAYSTSVLEKIMSILCLIANTLTIPKPYCPTKLLSISSPLNPINKSVSA